MGIFDKLRKQTAASRLKEEQLYEAVVDELQAGTRRNGLWAKALANSNGDESKAKALYIAYRVQSIKDEHEIYMAVNEKEEEKRNQEIREQELQNKKKEKYEETKKANESIEILKEKGYQTLKKVYGWQIIEPLGGRQKITTANELYEYAISRKKHKKT